MQNERHHITMLVENEPGVTARVSGLFASRDYNIETICGAPTGCAGAGAGVRPGGNALSAGPTGTRPGGSWAGAAGTSRAVPDHHQIALKSADVKIHIQ